MKSDQDIYLSYQEMVRACQDDHEFFVRIIEEDVITVQGNPEQATYSGLQLARVRRAQRIHRDFDASATATALILQLLDELEQLRKGGRRES